MKNTGIFKKVLVAVDGSEHSDRAVTYGIQLTRQNKCKLYFLYVIDQKIIESYKILKKDSNKIRDELSEKGHVILSRIKKLAVKNEIPVETKMLVGIPYQRILDYSQELNVDLIIIGHERYYS